MTSSKTEEQTLYESGLAQDLGKLAAKAVDQAEIAKDKVGEFFGYCLTRKKVMVKITPLRN